MNKYFIDLYLTGTVELVWNVLSNDRHTCSSVLHAFESKNCVNLTQIYCKRSFSLLLSCLKPYESIYKPDPSRLNQSKNQRI